MKSFLSLSIKLGVFFAICAFGLAMLPAQPAAAAEPGVGFFEGRSADGTLQSTIDCGVGPQSWHRVLCGGISNYSGNKTGFINDIKGKLSSGDSQTKLAAVFIIYTMLGYTPGNNRSPSSDEIAEWEARVSNPLVTITSRNVTAYPNSAYVHYASDGVSDMAFIDNTATNEPSLVFRYDGADVYYLKLACANPLGDMPGLPESTSWDASGDAYVNGESEVDAYPGDTVKFTYQLNSIGTATIPSINWTTTGGSNGTVNNLAVGDSKSLPSAAPGFEAYTVPTVAPGTQICRHMTFRDSEDNAGNETSNDACVTVRSNYDLYPGTQGGSYVPEPLNVGETRDLTGQIENTGYDSDVNSHYEVHQFVVSNAVGTKPDFSSAGGPFTDTHGSYRYATANHVDNQACSGWLSGIYAGKISDCSLKEQGNREFATNTSSLSPFTINADDYDPGDWVCQFVSVSLYKFAMPGDSKEHRISHPVCVVIAKQPSMQVWGDDVHVGDGFTVTNNKASVIAPYREANNTDGVKATFGSWAEYGIFAPAPDGYIKTASGGAISGAKGYTPGLISDSAANALSFSNTDSSQYGKWTAAQQVKSIEQFALQYPEGAAVNSPTVDLSSVGAQDSTIKYVRLTNPGETQLKGEHNSSGTIILISDQTVRITGNVTINSGQKAIGQLGYAPQVIIIASNITIDPGVTTIDAWLVARASNSSEPLSGPNGKISTCGSIQADGNYTNGLRLSECNNPLRINGAVIAKEVQFRRTYGADRTTGIGTPAEVINLRADAYMWARPISAGATTSLPIKTTFTVELPPRF